MIGQSKKVLVGLAALMVTVAIALLCSGVADASISKKLLFTGLFGREVNLTEFKAHGGLEPELEDVCYPSATVECQRGKSSAIQGGFKFDEGVAVGPSPSNYVYVADESNNRVQAFTPAGRFVKMFGWKVDETTEGNVCPVNPGDKCRAGQAETKGVAGVIAKPASVAVDEQTGDVYVWEFGGKRIEKYHANGEFVVMLGKEVNETNVKKREAQVLNSEPVTVTVAEENTCPFNPGDACKLGVANASKSNLAAGFKASRLGNLLAVGGPQDLLYVGDEERIQEIGTDGKWVSEVNLASLIQGAEGKVKALTVDSSGDVYFVYNNGEEGGTGVREYHASGGTITATPGALGAAESVTALALDPLGRLAAMENKPVNHGAMFEVSTGQPLSEFSSSIGMKGTVGVAFNPSGELYAADNGNQAVEIFAPAPVADVVTGAVEGKTTNSAILTGEIEPKNVNGTTAWFEWGISEALGSGTTHQAISSGSGAMKISEGLANLRPNQRYYYRIAAEDENNREPEPPLTGSTLSFQTLPLPPKIEMAPETTFVHSESAVFSGSLNPENALTLYGFEYGVCPSPSSACGNCLEQETCTEVGYTAFLASNALGNVGLTEEAVGLKPATTYRVRLVAINEHEEEAAGPEGEFTTNPPVTVEAVTGSPSGVSANSAVISGEVNPDGQPAVYTFELGVYNGAGTVYTVVGQGSTGADVGTVPESLRVTGLQPGTTYAYKIKIESAYGHAEGAPVVFTTESLLQTPPPPVVMQMLPTPSIAFPRPGVLHPEVECKRGFHRDRQGRCVKNRRRKHRGKSSGRKRSRGHSRGRRG